MKSSKNPSEFVQLKEKMEHIKKVSKLPPSKRCKYYFMTIRKTQQRRTTTRGSIVGGRVSAGGSGG